MRPVVSAIETMLTGSEPNPTLVMDRCWNLVMANEAALIFLTDVAPHLTEPPINIVELTLHPDGLASQIHNLEEVAAHLIHRIQRQYGVTGDERLADLAALAARLVPDASSIRPISTAAAVTVQMCVDGDAATFLSVVSTFGTALDVTAAELIIETFYNVTDRSASE